MRIPAQQPRKVPCEIAFVAEAPGETEELLGEPLVGPSGRIFNSLLHTLNIRREDCLVTNVLDFKLPGNSVKNIGVKRYKGEGEFARWCEQSVDSGTYFPEHLITEHLTRLRAELQGSGAKLVVGLGGLAVWALLSMRGHGIIGKVRGTVHAGQLTDQPVLVTYHPAYLLPGRSPQTRSLVLSDLSKGLEYVRGETREEFGEFTEVARVSDIDSLLARLDPPVAVDIETVRYTTIDCIGFSDGKLTFSVPFFDNKTYKPAWSEPDEAIARVSVCRWLSSRVPKIFQNGSYDVQVLWEAWHVQTRGWEHDTRILHKSLWSEMKADLATMAATHLRLPSWKPIKGSAEKPEV